MLTDVNKKTDGNTNYKFKALIVKKKGLETKFKKFKNSGEICK